MFYPEPDIHYSTNLNFEEIKMISINLVKFLILVLSLVESYALVYSIMTLDVRY